MSNNLLLKDNKLIRNSDVLYKWSAGNKLARAYSTGVWNKPEVGGRLSEIGLYPRVFDTYKWLVDNNLYDNLVFGINRQAGFLPNEVTGADHLHTAYDLSKYENDAIQATAANQPKIASKAWEFDGSSDFIYSGDRGDVLGYGLPKITYSCWIYSTKYSEDRYEGIIGLLREGLLSYGQGMKKYNNIIIGYSSLLNDKWHHSLRMTLTDIGWNHIALVMDAPNMGETGDGHLYLNGQLQTTYTNVVDGWDYALAVGCSYFQPDFEGEFFDGQINDGLIISKALSAAQITSYYNLTKSKYGH